MTSHRLILKGINATSLDAKVRKVRRLTGQKWTRSGLIVEALAQLRESGKLEGFAAVRRFGGGK